MSSELFVFLLRRVADGQFAWEWYPIASIGCYPLVDGCRLDTSANKIIENNSSSIKLNAKQWMRSIMIHNLPVHKSPLVAYPLRAS